MMQVSFGLIKPTLQEFSFFFFRKKTKKVKLLILLLLGIYVDWLRKFSFSSRASYFRRDLGRVEIEAIEYCVDRLFAGILWWFLRFIQTAFPELVHMMFVGVFWSLENIDQLANPLFDGVHFPECIVVFVGLEKDFIARIEMFLMGRDSFHELCFPWNEFIEDRLDFSCEHSFCRRASHWRVRIRDYLQKLGITCRNCCNALSVCVPSAFFKALFRVSTNLSPWQFDLGWYWGVLMWSTWYLFQRSLNLVEVNWAPLCVTTQSATPKRTNSSGKNPIVQLVVAGPPAIFSGYPQQWGSTCCLQIRQNLHEFSAMDGLCLAMLCSS